MAHRVRRRAQSLRQRRQPRLQLPHGRARWRRGAPLRSRPVGGRYATSGFHPSGIPGRGIADAFAITPYARYAPGRWYVEVAIAAAYNDASVARDIVFPGQARAATGKPRGFAFLSQLETGTHLDLDARTVLKPFAAVQGIVLRQGSFTESGAGAADLDVAGNTTGSAL